MVGKHNYIEDDQFFEWLKLLIVLATIIILGYLFCMPSVCY
jgi:hypothetical protein